MKKSDVIDMYTELRMKNYSIPSEHLEFMKHTCLKAIEASEQKELEKVMSQEDYIKTFIYPCILKSETLLVAFTSEGKGVIIFASDKERNAEFRPGYVFDNWDMSIFRKLDD